MVYHPSKHETFNPGCLNVWPALQTWPNIETPNQGKRLTLAGIYIIRYSKEYSTPSIIAPVDWPRTKSWDISLDSHIWKYRSIITSKIVFLESVTFQFHAHTLSSEVAQSRKSYGHFCGPWGRDRSQSPPCWFFRVKHIHQSTASERTTQLHPLHLYIIAWTEIAVLLCTVGSGYIPPWQTDKRMGHNLMI